MFTVEDAQLILQERHRRVKPPTQKMAGFELENGRQIALRLRRASVRLILDAAPPNLHGVSVKEIYEPYSPRSSNLRANAPKLAIPRPACLVEVRDESALLKLLSWYEGGRTTEQSATSDSETTENVGVEEGPDHWEAIAGFERNPAIRKVIEARAVQLAKEFYIRRGYSVEEKGKPYDLRCALGDTVIHVEVKGTRGTGKAVILTKHEVEHARSQSWQTDLFIVTDIVVSDYGGSYVASGGRLVVKENWVPGPESLSPIAYSYAVD